MAKEEEKETVTMIKKYCDLCGAHDEECESMLIGKFRVVDETTFGIGCRINKYDKCDIVDHVCQVCQSGIDRFMKVLRK